MVDNGRGQPQFTRSPLLTIVMLTLHMLTIGRVIRLRTRHNVTPNFPKRHHVSRNMTQRLVTINRINMSHVSVSCTHANLRLVTRHFTRPRVNNTPKRIRQPVTITQLQSAARRLFRVIMFNFSSYDINLRLPNTQRLRVRTHFRTVQQLLTSLLLRHQVTQIVNRRFLFSSTVHHRHRLTTLVPRRLLRTSFTLPNTHRIMLLLPQTRKGRTTSAVDTNHRLTMGQDVQNRHGRRANLPIITNRHLITTTVINRVHTISIRVVTTRTNRRQPTLTRLHAIFNRRQRLFNHQLGLTAMQITTFRLPQLQIVRVRHLTIQRRIIRQ